jgi:hypothetical protein
MFKNLLIVFCCAVIFISCAKKPEACFTFSRTEGLKLNDTITLINCSTNYENLIWTLPQGAQTSIESPRIKLNAIGNFEVNLKVGTTNFVKQSTLNKSIKVAP